MYDNIYSRDRLQRCIDLASTVEHLHEKGIVYGDIKVLQDNIIVSDTGDVQLVNCGNTAPVESATFIFTRTMPLLTCSVRFTAPEILDDTIQQYTTKSDIYALGMTILQILTGKLPYAEDSDKRVLANVLRGILPTRPELDKTIQIGGIEDIVWGLLERCWERDPNIRPTATEVRRTLLEIQRESGETSGI